MTQQKDSGSQAEASGPSVALDVGLFASDEPTRDLSLWQRLFSEDVGFPIKSTRPLVGPLLVGLRRLLRPFVRVPQSDLWERQRVFNLIVLEKLQILEQLSSHIASLDQRLSALEAADKARVEELMRYSDALYSRVDAKLDNYSELARQQVRSLEGLAVAAVAGEGPAGAGSEDSESAGRAALTALQDARYLAFENRERGSREAVLARVERYWGDLQGQGPVLDLGCGRGEVLEFLQQRGVEAAGVDGNSAMVAHCIEHGLQVTHADLNQHLSSVQPRSLGAITCFHVIEHLEAEQLGALLKWAFRALRPGGLVLLETPNPKSVVVGASAFWVDPTHKRPVHPVALQSALQESGFVNVEIRTAQPFPDDERLPEISITGDDPQIDRVADQVNRLRDRLDDVLFGDRDFAALGRIAP